MSKLQPRRIKDTTRKNWHWDGLTLAQIEEELRIHKERVGEEQFNATRFKVNPHNNRLYTLFTFKRWERLLEWKRRITQMQLQGHL